MDVKDLQSEATLGERNNDGSKYATSGVTLPYSRNKPYQDVNSVSLGKVDAPTARPCAVIGPDRVLPPPVSSDTIKKSAFEAWCADNVYRNPPEYPHKMTNYNTPIRNISPRQTFQENMQRIMVPPTYNSLKANEEYNSSTKNTKPNIPIDTKYCEVPYSGNPVINEQKSVRNTELSASNMNPVLARNAPQGWPSHLRQSRPYGAPELYQYQDFTNCTGPRPVPMTRPHRTAHEDLNHGYADPYCHDIRFKPYTTVKDRYPHARYDFISNYSSPFHPPSAYPPHKYDMQKPIPQPYAYQQVPLKYLDTRIPDPVIDGYQRSTQQSNYNLPFHNQMMHPAYGPFVGNCIQNKFPCPPESTVKSVAPNKQPYEANKMYAEYENRSKTFPVSENYYFNEMQRAAPHMKSQVMPNYAINMHRFPPHPYYTKDRSLKNYEYMPHFRNIDPSMLSQSRIPSQFSPNGITISSSDTNLSLDNSQIQGSTQEDYGYVSQSPTGSMRNMDFAVNRISNEFYRQYDSRYGHTLRPPPMMAKHEQNVSENSKDKKNIDVRQFLQMWSEVDDENAENATKETISPFSNNVNKTTNQYETVKNQDQLYVLGLVNVPSEELSKYEHIQKVSKLPENIKGYNSIELLNQFEEVIESSNVNNFKSKSSTPKDIAYQMPLKHASSHLSLLPRPVSPLDVEAKISQSVIHKEVGCNFEIKPCSPKMLNVEAATPIKNLLGERVIEKVSNPLIITSPLIHSEDKRNCNVLNHQEQRKSPNENAKNTSCKMINTQFNSNDSVRPNYSLQELESNSGICLASLPRLDNDIELNFPEVNQQFINANKGESVITATKDLPSLSLEHIDNVNLTEHESNICQNPDKSYESPSVIDSEREFSKLSKYRKIRKYGPETIEKDSLTQNMRTDSVIIKNPENPRIFDQNKDTFTSSSIHEKDLPNNEKDFPNNKSIDTDKETSKELNNAKPTDIAIDFSLNKNDNNNTAPNTIDNYVENFPKLDSSKINNLTKHSEISLSAAESLKDHNIENKFKIKPLFCEEDGSVRNDKRKDDLFKENCKIHKKENECSQTATEPQLSEFDICENTDDMRSLEKSPHTRNKKNRNCEIKSKQGITIAKYEENKIETENYNSTSIASIDDVINKESNKNNIDTIPGLMGSSPDRQVNENSNSDLPDLNAVNAIPSTSRITQCAQEGENENKPEMLTQDRYGENIDATLTDQNDVSFVNEGNEILSTQNVCDSLDAPKQYAQKDEKGNKNEVCPENNDGYYSDATFKNKIDLITERLDIKQCCSDKLYESTENNKQNINQKQYAQKDDFKEEDFKEVSLKDGQDADNTDVTFEITTDIIQEKLDKNLSCGEKHFNIRTENTDVTLRSNITLQLANENFNSMLDKSAVSETNQIQEVLDNQQIYARKETSNESNENNSNNELSKTKIEDTILSNQNSNDLVTKDVKESDILCYAIPLSEPQTMITASILYPPIIDNNPLNSNEESNPLESSLENSSTFTNSLLNTDKDSNQLPLSFETSQKITNPTIKTSDATSHPYLNVSNHEDTNLDKMDHNNILNTNILPIRHFEQNVIIESSIAMEKNDVKKTIMDEKRKYSDVTGNEMGSEKNVFYTRNLRSCKLKKELFSPFILKLISHNEGPINPQALKSSNVEANSSCHYSSPNCVHNVEIELIKSSNEKTCNVKDSIENVEIVSCDFFCKGIDRDAQKNELITGNVLENEAQNMTISSGSSPDNNIEMRISASEIHTDLYTEISSKECLDLNSTDKPSIECVDETLKNSFMIAELPENSSLTRSLLLPSSKKLESDNIGISENSNLSNDNNANLGGPEDNNEDTEQILPPSISEDIITNSDVNIECALNKTTLHDSSEKYMLQNEYKPDSSRSCLKRSLSDSALDSFNDSSDAFYTGWRSKRPKNQICNVFEPDIIFDSNSQNNRRKSISSIYNEQNVSFCILIDDNCIITEEEENDEQGEICFTEVSEACLTDLQESVSEYNNITPHTPEPSEECNHDYSETQEAEDSWVDDVGCMETVVSDDVAEDITISASSSPERLHSPENDESGIIMNSEHTDKIKHIYGAKMCNDDVMFLETLYRTPQMNVNKIINRESQVTEEYVQYYNKDSLEKVLSESSCPEDLHSGLEKLKSSDANPLNDVLLKNMRLEENLNQHVMPVGESSFETNNKNESYDFQNYESLFTTVDKTQDGTVHSCESSIDNVFSYNQRDEYRSYTSSTSPEVSSTTSEERNSSILLKITNYKGSRVSQINDFEHDTKSISCKFTELNDYSSSQNFKTSGPLITKAAQKYIPPLEESLGDLKIRLPLPQHSLLRLKQLKLLKKEPKSNKCNTNSKPDIPKKPRPKFEDVLKSIDEIQFKMHKEKSKKAKKSIPKVVIKKNMNGSHYASTTNIKPFNPDLTGRKWQPWVFLEKNHFIDKMAIKNKRKAIFNHRKNTYVLADKFRKYKSIGNAKFVISQPNLHSSSIGHLKCTIRLKHTY